MQTLTLYFSSIPPIPVEASLAAVAALGFIGALFFLFRAGKWKREYRDLLLRHELLDERMALERQHAEEKLDLLEKAGSDMRLQFRNLSQEIFDEKTKIISRHNSESITSLLEPFREQIGGFRGRVEEIFLEETREQSSLKQEILQLRELNRRLGEEAANLTRALSGDRKLQGNWGEMVLERLLEQSGLRPGSEYESQPSHRDKENRLFRPDVIIHLPKNRDIVIDSKVSLSAWSRYVNADTDEDRRKELTAHLNALREHLKSLHAKDYRSLPEVRSLDFVLMFVPIDAAFMAAMQHEEKLLDDMYTRNVLIVTPTTLMATLRTIDHFWQTDRRNKNAVEIAERASSLYDKLKGFIDDMVRLGHQIDTCRETYDKAVNKLSRGRGNLLSQAARFPELGVKVKEELARLSDEDESGDDSIP